MSTAFQSFVTSVLVVFGVNTIACWALDLQVGTAGVLNFAFIIFQALGAYTVAVLTAGPSSAHAGQTYVLGLSLPFPAALAIAAVAGAAFAFALSRVGLLRRLRQDYQAIAMLVISLTATDFVESRQGFLNGIYGIAGVPQPFSSHFTATGMTYQWFYVAITAVVCLIVYSVLHRVTASPLGRALRACRESEKAAEALGKNVPALKLTAYTLGGAIAAVSGGVFVGYLGAWAPTAWLYPETFVYFTAIIIGGRGNKLGALIGAFVVPGFGQVSQFFPVFGNPVVAVALQWILTGVLLLVFLWFWPRGIVPERRRAFSVGGAGTAGYGLPPPAGSPAREGTPR